MGNAALARSRNQCERCPARRSGGNPLIVPVRKSAFKVRLDPRGSRADMPRSVGRLRIHEKTNSSLIDGVGRRNRTALRERVQGLPGCVRIARHARKF